MTEQNEKQSIEEMANILEQAKIDAHATIGSMNYGFGMWYAKACYNAGYRKQSAGEWAVTGTERAWNNAEYPIERTCSVCGMRRNIETQVGWNFCPNCGAKMKGGAE